MILFFVGNASHALSSSNSLAILEVSVILSNYRGYGSSDGRLTESAIVANAKITLQKLLEHYSDRPVVLIGKNLGIAIARNISNIGISKLATLLSKRKVEEVT